VERRTVLMQRADASVADRERGPYYTVRWFPESPFYVCRPGGAVSNTLLMNRRRRNWRLMADGKANKEIAAALDMLFLFR
jgi:DNA-binding NarL/FixJ family response regulator